MYHQLTSQQRSQIFALLQRKTPRKEIALIVGRSQSTLCREIKRNSTDRGNYLWEKAHAQALKRRKRTTANKKPDRPAEADGKRFGDFEMDLIVDAYGHAILCCLNG